MAAPQPNDNETDQASVRKYVSILVAVGLAMGGYAFWKNREKAPAAEAAASQASPRKAQTPVATGGKRPSIKATFKLDVPETAVTTDSVRHEVKEWLDKTFQIEGLTPEPAHLPKDRWSAFAKAAIALECGSPEAPPRQKIADMARDLVPVAHEHPVSAFLVGMLTIRQPGSDALLEKAVEGLESQAGMETLAFHAAAGLALASGEGTAEETMKKRVDQTLKALRKALDAEAGYSKMPDRLTAYLLMSGHLKGFFEAVHEPFWEEVSKTESAKPWVKKWIEGLHCLQKGWDARGGGYSNTVSNDGMAVFKHESEKARRLLTQAWELNPQDASPAVTLIYSSLSLGRDTAPKEMRRWFDETLKLQVDVAEAAQHMLWGLRPRWFGSHKKMEDFGLACLETNRFDSCLPWVLLQAHRDAASEWDVPDEYFQKMYCYDRLQALFEGAENEPKREAWRSIDRTHAAIASFKCGEYAQAQRWLEKLDFKPHADVVASWGMDADLLLGKTAAYAGESGAKLREAETAANRLDSARALELYQEALKPGGTQLSTAGFDYLEKQVAIMKIEKAVQAGETVPLMPEGNFRAWSQEGSGWKLDEGALLHLGREVVRTTTCLARIGPSFTLEGEIEVTDPGKATQVWLSYGYPQRINEDRWVALRFAYDGQKTLALLSNGMNRPLEHPEIQVESRFKFKYVGSRSGISLYINDKPVFENAPVPQSFVAENQSQVGIGAATKSEKTRVKIHALTVKR